MEKQSVKSFYDSFVKNQANLGISIRHRIIFDNLKRIGLQRNSNVLEVGCGIGTVSKLIVDGIPEGQFLGCDISPKSIEYANSFVNRSNAEFIVSNMSDFSSKLNFDFVVFPDVLEHIPEEEHLQMFKNISKYLNADAKILINIPEPNALAWVREHQPEKLQIIDQSLSMQKLVNNMAEIGMTINKLNPYSIHCEVPNYLEIVFVKNPIVTNYKTTGKIKQFIQNVKVKFFHVK
ncbi:MAG: class I SAM-dependent methyltransferase [Putridiphycobacter sp.]|nr:class I SAM-dependent methyltransferase [Putridiphycobacter sp.]